MVGIGGTQVFLKDGTYEGLFASALVTGGTEIKGNTIVPAGTSVRYHPTLAVPNQPQNASFTHVLGQDQGQVKADSMEGMATITLTGGKLSATTIDFSTLDSLEGMEKLESRDGLIVIPSDLSKEVIVFGGGNNGIIFLNGELNDDTIGLICCSDDAHIAGVAWVNQAFVMKGIEIYGDIINIFDINVEAGWNYYFFTYTGKGYNTAIITAAKGLPASYKWTIIDKNFPLGTMRNDGGNNNNNQNGNQGGNNQNGNQG